MSLKDILKRDQWFGARLHEEIVNSKESSEFETVILDAFNCGSVDVPFPIRQRSVSTNQC